MKNKITNIEHMPTCKVCNGHCWMEKINKQRIGEIIGEASMCWSEVPKGVFQSDKASELIDEILKMINYKSVDDCYLSYNEEGYLVCIFNHKIGEECLMDKNN